MAPGTDERARGTSGKALRSRENRSWGRGIARGTSYAAAMCSSLWLAACTSNTASDWAPLYQMVKSEWTDSGSLALQQVASVPYATIGVRIGDSSQALFVLASDNSGEMLWLAGHRIAITTRDGRIVHTAGLEHNLTALSVDTREGRQTTWSDPSIRLSADLGDPPRYAVQIVCARDAPEPETITILGKAIDTRRIKEHCEAADASWSFTNEYWISQSGDFVWRSIQNIHPSLDPIEIETLRPPG